LFLRKWLKEPLKAGDFHSGEGDFVGLPVNHFGYFSHKDSSNGGDLNAHNSSTYIRRRHYLYPGMIFVHAQRHLVTLILGSCVLVCLWDSKTRIGEINHYLLPFWNGGGLPTTKYGNISIVKLIEKMLASPGCHKDHLIAKIFGRASMWDKGGGLLTIGDRNCELAKELLHKHAIPFQACDLGGKVGRKLVFNAQDGSVLVRRQCGQLKSE